MARGARHSPPEQSTLPKVSFEKVDDEDSTRPGGVHDLQARSYGYNDFSEFTRPEHYIRYIEPLESELATQVEYDMDEQDQEWLDSINLDRKREQLNKASYELFEIVMDRLEKEWFDLTKNIPKPDLAMPSEDSTCAVCDDSEGENSNAIVFCDGCNLAVHQDCYGVPYIPEGQWLCRKCTVSPENPVSCLLCPNEGGAFKQTVDGGWVHLLCAIWVPETRVANESFMEPITGVERISKQRWKLRCSICDYRGGACIQCAKSSCFLAFHTTCARKEKLLLPMKSQAGAEPTTLTCYCERHLPKEQQDARAAALAAEEQAESSDNTLNEKHSKTARAYAKTYKTGPPLVPQIIVDRILQYIAKISLRKKPEFVYMVCRYWSLKREARRGAPLLKRLHLEPWTANAGLKLQSEEEKALKLKLLQQLRSDLEKVKELTELTRKREARKRRQAELIQNIVSEFFLPHEPPLRMAFERIMSFDRNNYFKNPVSRNEVPDYFDVVQSPMCWSMIDSKLDRHEYWDVQRFKDDVDLVLTNAILYNKPGTTYYKTAIKIRNSAQPILDELDKLRVRHPHVAQADSTSTEMDVDEPPSQSVLGDLEPPQFALELLSSQADLRDDLSFLSNQSPLSSLFSYEVAKPKPPPPPAPPVIPKPRRSKTKAAKKDRSEEYERRRIARRLQKEAQATAVAAAHAATVNQSDSLEEETLRLQAMLIAPRTRKQAATAASFEAQAGVIPISEDHNNNPSTSQVNDSSREGLSVAKPRRNVNSPHHPSIVHDVDSRDSFAMFEAGWILPERTRRRAEKPSLPPPQATVPTKRPRTGSRLSVYSTSAQENETLEPSTSGSGLVEEPTPSSPSQPSTTGQEHDLNLTLQDRIMLPTTISRNLDGSYVIEELDTPATRSEKNKRMKALRLAGPGVPPPTPLYAPPPDPRLLPSVLASRHLEPPWAVNVEPEHEDSSSLSELSSDHDEAPEEAEDEVNQEEEPEANVAPPKSPTPPPPPPPPPQTSSPQGFPPGTIVWAKIVSFPWWPATIRDKSDPLIPEQIIGMLNSDKQQIIQFFDEQHSWQCVEPDKVKLFNVDKKLDQEFLQKQRVKTPSLKTRLRTAFREASSALADAKANESPEDGRVE